MFEFEDIQIDLPREFPDVVNVLIGENGSGKSIALNQLAQRYVAQNYNVIAIANCLFDKFTFKSSSFHFIGARDGAQIIEKSINDVLTETYINRKKKNRSNEFIIREAFNKIGYDPAIGFSIEIWNERRRLSEEEEHEIIYSIFQEYERKMLFEEFLDQANSFKEKNYNSFNNDKIFWFDFDSTSNYNNYNDINYEALRLLQKNKLIKIKFHFKKYNFSLPINKASSGQLHILFNILFIASKINRDNKSTIILIDEPESSLHPRWQKSYLEDLLSFFYRYNIKIIVATHSPLIISSLNNIKPLFYKERVDYSIYEVKNYKLKYLAEGDSRSIESIFWEVFGVITPENSFLAHHIVDVIHNVNDKKINKELAISELISIRNAAFDDRQRDAVDLAIRIIEGEFKNAF